MPGFERVGPGLDAYATQRMCQMKLAAEERKGCRCRVGLACGQKPNLEAVVNTEARRSGGEQHVAAAGRPLASHRAGHLHRPHGFALPVRLPVKKLLRTQPRRLAPWLTRRAHSATLTARPSPFRSRAVRDSASHGADDTRIAPSSVPSPALQRSLTPVQHGTATNEQAWDGLECPRVKHRLPRARRKARSRRRTISPGKFPKPHRQRKRLCGLHRICTRSHAQHPTVTARLSHAWRRATPLEPTLARSSRSSFVGPTCQPAGKATGPA